MHQRGTAADRLADIIQVIRLARRTGQLIAERGEIETALEEGIIVFADGQVMEARAGSKNGVDAFNWLSTWQSCRFTFISSALSSPTPNVSSKPSQQLPYRSTTAPLPPSNGHAPSSMTSDPIPHRLRHPNEALPFFERLGLTRTHRHLFLLIDGQRATTELRRLMQHRSRADEVYTLLSDLERAGLIQY